jgi:hypothetical protein
VLKRGDHVCALYNTETELAELVAEFLARGLQRWQRCWYLPAAEDPEPVRTALRARGVDTAQAEQRGELRIFSAAAAYTIRGDFDPVETIARFNDAIEGALSDGFTGFRAAANMSWAMDLPDGFERLITYEAMLRSLFSSAWATGLCLYDRQRMPLAVIDGALSTHPLVRMRDAYAANPFYNPAVRTLGVADPAAVRSKINHLNASTRGSDPA